MLYPTLDALSIPTNSFSMAIVAVLAMCRLPIPGGGCRHVLLLRPIGKERRLMNGRRRGETRAETAEKSREMWNEWNGWNAQQQKN